MKLEGIDPLHPSMYCVLSVAEVKGHRLRLHFDGYSECYDFWTNADSPFIFPVGWVEKNGRELQPPLGIYLALFGFLLCDALYNIVVTFPDESPWSCLQLKKVESVYSSSWEHMSELWSVTCHMGSHSITCHPTQVNAPRYCRDPK